MQSVNTQTEQIAERALAWCVKMRSADFSQQEQKELEAWLLERDEHLHEFERVQEFWNDLDMFRDHPSVWEEKRDAAFDRRGRLARQQETYLRAPRAKWLTIAAVAAVLLIAPVAWFSINNWPSAELYETAIGEQRRITLDDHSIVSLNTQTVIEVDYSSNHRHIHLLRGQAHFNVQSDPGRPFVVFAANTAVKAIGTEFEVYRQKKNEITVSVLEGVVHVSRTDETVEPVKQDLVRGQKLSLVPSGVRDLEEVGIIELGAWRSGKLIFDSTPLSDAVTEFNRYTRMTIRIGDDQLKELKISGVFDSSESLDFVEALTRSFAVRSIKLWNGDTMLLTESPSTDD